MSDKAFSVGQEAYINEKMIKFCTCWNHHKNNLVATKSTYLNTWEIAASKSWHAQYMN